MAARRKDRLEVVSVADRVYAALREGILEGRLAPESRLHQENLSDELGVSRTPVREALARLAADGLVELHPNRGARVATVALADMRAAYEARLGVEPSAARLAAERRSPADLQRLTGALDAQRAARGARATYAATRALHLAVVDAAHNEVLARFAQTLWAGRVGLHVYYRQADRRLARDDVEEHAAIVGAIARRDPEAAERLMREHIAASLVQLIAGEEAAGAQAAGAQAAEAQAAGEGAAARRGEDVAGRP